MKEAGYDGPKASAWPRRLTQGPARIIGPEELRSWVVHEDDRLFVVSKPGDVVVHPSKHGPWSSLVGAARELLGLPTVHLVFRLDRETSGIVVIAKEPRMASRLQTAMQDRRVGKAYTTILMGEMKGPVRVDQPLGDDTASPVFMKSGVREDGQASVTLFEPVAAAAGFTLVRVTTETGRKHQIRAHAQWLGHSIVGDKIYGPDARLYLDFIDHGWSAALEEKLLLPRQALHCSRIDLRTAGMEFVFDAPLPADMAQFCRLHGMDPALALPAGT
ncbi:MAG TPA: RluA family pseudouridine synthase [Opitutaceae bacterium]|nr:RluA family pseudouridine synthase [Opitutaceae bacterium]